jgi:uncharacterized protein
LRVVLDTNIFIAGLLTDGICSQIVDAWGDKAFTLLTSKWQIAEVKRILNDKFADATTVRERASLITDLRASDNVTLRKIASLSTDPDDNHILGIALEGQADYLVSLDSKHVLALKKVERTRILAPKDFAKVVKVRKAKNPTQS